MFFHESDTEGIQRIEADLHKAGIFHGLPLGIGIADLETNSPELQGILEIYDELMFKEIQEIVANGARSLVFEQMKMALDIQNLPLPERIQKLVDPPKEPAEEEWEFYREWLSTVEWKGRRRTVKIEKNKVTGKFRSSITPYKVYRERLQFYLATGFFRETCGVLEAELKACERLMEALTPHQKHQYVFQDCVVEHGRSGVLYLIRKNRPTLAIRDTGKVEGDTRNGGEVLCAMCYHPLAYYTNTWAGALPPSDEVLAHLLMIRADEHLFWKRCNQHPIHDIRSGV